MDEKLKRYQGIFPAFYACYDDTGRVSTSRTKSLAKYLLAKGVTGLYVGGSSGECIYQSVEERKTILEAVMDAVGVDGFTVSETDILHGIILDAAKLG